ncbi:hypothetical protein CLCR_09306 [Cladophialophora carrionii]|uniref:Uncharacterized protein n=1 Tax=Cladophialophora carrionii TaxID=86049 RepID=A0A1C1CUY7_9EURO|nr:hypothetical protein CLCR_09306 [Cladophialophora carrionii]
MGLDSMISGQKQSVLSQKPGKRLWQANLKRYARDHMDHNPLGRLMALLPERTSVNLIPRSRRRPSDEPRGEEELVSGWIPESKAVKSTE